MAVFSGIILFMVCVVVPATGIFFVFGSTKKQRRSFESLASRLGLSYEHRGSLDVPAAYTFLEHLSLGKGLHVLNLFRGSFQGHPVLAFNYQYTIRSQFALTSHQLSSYIVRQGRTYPPLHIYPRNYRVLFGLDSVRHEVDARSAAFSKAFVVTSPDAEWARAACHPALMDYLLANPDLIVEINEAALSLYFFEELEVKDVEERLEKLLAVHELLAGVA